MKNVLVTGAAGFIGSHLVDELLARDWNVIGVDNFDPFYGPAAKWDNISSHLTSRHYRLVEADIKDLSMLQRELNGEYDVIVHLAAKAGVRPSIEDPIAYQETNVRGTHNLLELARAWKTPHFVFASSSSVYGVNPNVPWKEEDKVLMPISPYASTKVSGELLGHVYSHLFGIRFVALRFFTVFGPRQRPDLAIHKFASLMRAGRPIPVFGTGDTRRDYTFAGDIVAGIYSAMSYTAKPYEIFNLGNNDAITLTELIEELARVLNVNPKLSFQPEQAGDVPQTWASIDKAQNELGYRPKTSLAAGLKAFADWFDARESAPRPALAL